MPTTAPAASSLCRNRRSPLADRTRWCWHVCCPATLNGQLMERVAIQVLTVRASRKFSISLAFIGCGWDRTLHFSSLAQFPEEGSRCISLPGLIRILVNVIEHVFLPDLNLLSSCNDRILIGSFSNNPSILSSFQLEISTHIHSLSPFGVANGAFTCMNSPGCNPASNLFCRSASFRLSLAFHPGFPGCDVAA